MGDMTKYKEWNLNEPVNLLVGGTPCQSFSVAGLRKGLEDPRGNLALTYIGILDKFRPKWCVWENVPGVLSSNGGRDLGSFLGALAELGYGFAYRVLDAQYFGVPQRRRRIFVVGCLGDWESPAKVLFESDCLLRNTPPSRKKREAIAPFTPSSFGNYGEGVGTIRANGGDLGGGSETLVTTGSNKDVFGTLMANAGDKQWLGNQEAFTGDYHIVSRSAMVYETHPADSRVKEMGDVSQTVTSRWGTGGGNVPLVQSIALQDVSGRDKKQNGKGWNDDGISYTLDAAATQGVAYAFEPGIAKREGGDSRFSEELSPTLRREMGDNQVAVAYSFNHSQQSMMVGDNVASPLMSRDYKDPQTVLEAYSIREDAKANNFSATPLEVTPALQALRPSVQSHHAQTFVAQGVDTDNGTIQGDFVTTMTADMAGPTYSGPKVMEHMAVRRLTPVECERLQGFPDGYTNIPWRGKEESPDGQRYKAMGNSMAVPVMSWLGKRIMEVENDI
jgi:DNA (cytosine-5)-methyltransferase 1